MIENITKEFITTNLLTVKGTLNNHKVKKLEVTPQELYNIYNNISTPICKCGKDRTFYTFPKGYRLTCSSRECAANNEKGLIKRKATNLKKYGVEEFTSSEAYKNSCLRNLGVENPSFLPRCLEKGKQTKIVNGTQVPDDNLPLWELYKKLVWNETRKHYDSIPGIHLRGRVDENPDAYHLDHKVSISYGFKNNVLPIIIGGIRNLEMVPAIDNLSKHSDCSTTLERIISNV